VNSKCLLLRADFALVGGGDKVMSKRWRRVLVDALPPLLGYAGKARVRLHDTGSFTAWVRIPVERWPGSNRLHALTTRLRARLEDALLPVSGLVLDLAVRRFRKKLALLPGSAQWMPDSVAMIIPIEAARREGGRSQVQDRQELVLYPQPPA
jgi:hypothetical protein